MDKYLVEINQRKVHFALIANPHSTGFSRGIIGLYPVFKCMYVNWVKDWPEEALKMVAYQKLEFFQNDV